MGHYVTLALHLVEQTPENLDLLKKACVLCYEGKDAQEAKQLHNQAWTTYKQAHKMLDKWLADAYSKQFRKKMGEEKSKQLSTAAIAYYTEWTILQPDYSEWDLITPKKHNLDAPLLLAIDRLRHKGIISGYTVTSSH